MTFIWYMVFQIWSAIFYSFTPSSPHPNSPKNQNLEKVKKKPPDVIILQKCTKNHDRMLYYFWDMVHDRCNYFSFWAIFCPFTPITAQKIKIKKKEKKPWRYIILHKCTKNYDLMIYGSWDMVCDRCNCYFSFWTTFCTFTPLKAQKIKILKKLIQYHKISSFYTCVPKIKIRWCTVPEICCATDRWMETEKVTCRGGWPT